MSMNEILLKACADGEENVVRKLIRKLPLVDINTKDDFGRSAISLAAKGGYDDIVKILIASGAQVSPQDHQRITPLHFAATGNHVEMVKVLITHGAGLKNRNKVELRPIDMVPYDSAVWQVLHKAEKGEMPLLPDPNADCIVPPHAIAFATKPKKKGKKKGKKGGKKKKKK